MAQFFLAYSVTLALCLYIIRKTIIRYNRLPLPPGPKGLPLLGNIQDLPPKGVPEWQHWLKYRDLYGPLSSVTVMGQTIIIIHDKEIALELFEKQWLKYSRRPSFVFCCELVGHEDILSFFPYNKQLREQRKLIAMQVGHKKGIEKYRPSLELEVWRFLLRNLNSPEDLAKNLQTMTASVMLKMLYGYAPTPNKFDPLIALVNRMMAELSEASVTGSWLVDIVPWLRYLPEGVPGTEFKRIARAWNKNLTNVVYAPVEFVKQQMARNIAKPSYVSGLIGSLNREISPQELKHIAYSATALYGGGADTTVTALTYFFRSMAFSPDVQQKAHEEIDRVVGAGRLPNLDDRENLTYVEAVMKETMRGHPIAPLSLPRLAESEDELRGYRIPKGALLMPSIGWFSRDPAVYHEPELFKPERYLEPYNEPHPRSFVFGFGRRICPGRRFAESTMFLAIASCLAVFDIKKDIDENGNEVEPAVGCSSGTISHVAPFRYRLMARSEKHAELLRRVEVDHPWEEGDAKFLDGLRHSVQIAEV